MRYYIQERDGSNTYIATDRARSLLDAGMASIWHQPEGSNVVVLKLKGK